MGDFQPVGGVNGVFRTVPEVFRSYGTHILLLLQHLSIGVPDVPDDSGVGGNIERATILWSPTAVCAQGGPYLGGCCPLCLREVENVRNIRNSPEHSTITRSWGCSGRSGPSGTLRNVRNTWASPTQGIVAKEKPPQGGLYSELRIFGFIRPRNACCNGDTRDGCERCHLPPFLRGCRPS